MIVGVPKEIKANENRVALVPGGAEMLVARGHEVYIESRAGEGSGFSDREYEKSGARLLPGAKEVFDKAEMIMKVKEPLPEEYRLIRDGQIVFTYFHFAASEELTLAIRDSGCTAVAYETVQKADGSLPLLVPMSEVAGRMAVQEGAKYLERSTGGRGVLLGGVPGVEPATVVILGGGVVGTNAAKMAAGLGANVLMLDVSLDRLRYLDDVMPKNVTTIASNPHNIRDVVQRADLLIGAVLIPGAKAPKLITRETLKSMKKSSVIVDVAVDQGGCIETSKPTTHANPIYTVEGVIHYGVANMPGGVPMTSTIALTNATLPYAVEIADKGASEAARTNEDIAKGVNMYQHMVTLEAVAKTFNLPYTPLEEALN